VMTVTEETGTTEVKDNADSEKTNENSTDNIEGE